MDPSERFLGLRLNLYVAAALTLAGAVWYWRTQHEPLQHSRPAAADAAIPQGHDERRPVPDAEGRTRPEASWPSARVRSLSDERRLASRMPFRPTCHGGP